MSDLKRPGKLCPNVEKDSSWRSKQGEKPSETN